MLIIMLLFLFLAIFNTIILKFPQFEIFKIIKKSKNKKTKQTFWLGLATNLGVGNLIGVSAAIYYGGPGVIFWMALFAFFASSFAYSETYFAITSQVMIENEVRSSTSFTILNYFKGKKGKTLATIFAFVLVLTNSIFFPPIQIHAIVNIIDKKYYLFFGSMLLLIIIYITNKGIKRILKFTDKIVPFLAISYTVVVILLIVLKIEKLPNTINLIMKSALSFNSFSSATILTTIQIGISKSLFSHEAGLGTMPSLVGIADKKEIKETASFQTLSVIIDTVILCSLTGILIIQYTDGIIKGDISMILSNCFQQMLGKFGLVISKIFIFFFGISSIFGQFYLGETNAVYFTIFNKKKYILIKKIFRILFYLGIILGIILSFEIINQILDIGMIILGLINILVIFSIQFKRKKEHKILEEINLK